MLFVGCCVQLQCGYCQIDVFDLVLLVYVVCEGDSVIVVVLLCGCVLVGVYFYDDQSDFLQYYCEYLLVYWCGLGEVVDFGQVLVNVGCICLLIVVCEGLQGVCGFNVCIEVMLVGVLCLGVVFGYFYGCLLFIIENSYCYCLFNGDIGICLGDWYGVVMVWFFGEIVDQLCGFYFGVLLVYESVFVMIVYKVQGLEFDEVWLQLLCCDNCVFLCELIYIGMICVCYVLYVLGSVEVMEVVLVWYVSCLLGLVMWLQGENIDMVVVLLGQYVELLLL